MSWFGRNKTEEDNSGWWGSGKRVANHQAWETASPFFAIRAKGREAREQGIKKQRAREAEAREAKGGRRNRQTRSARDNRREY